jgi:hypothetical protein
MKLIVNKQEINCSSLEWSGSKFNAARKVSFTYPSKLAYSINQGNAVFLYEGEIEVFQGFVFRKQYIHRSGEVTILAYDPLVYFLNSSGSFNFKTTTLGAVVNRVAADVKVPVGNIVDSTLVIKLEPMIGRNLYDVLLTALKEGQKKSGKIYIPIISKGNLIITAAGSPVQNFNLANKENIISSMYTESIENVRNKIIIVDDDGKKLGEVSGEGLSVWGTFQDVYRKESGRSATNEARRMLHGLDREAMIEAFGNINCISGRSVTVTDPGTNLKGLFYIDEDMHIWESGKYTMALQLNFKNIEEDQS